MRGVVLLACLATACAQQHVHLDPHPPGMSPEQRIARFDQIRSQGQVEEKTISCGGRHGCSREAHDVLVLANGESVRDVDDLSPVVPAGSNTALAIEQAHRARSSRNHWTLVLGLAGAVFVGGSIAAVAADNNWILAGTAVVTGLAIVVSTYAIYVRNQRVREATKHAFLTYDTDLASGLGVCILGLKVVPCEAPN